MSFPYQEDLGKDPGIIFENEEEKDNMNILIGANGSGKSNFIEIIKQFFNNIILDFIFDKKCLEKTKKSDIKQSIRILPKQTSKLTKHKQFTNYNATLEITINLSENDYKNIDFVCNYYKEINQMIKKYSNLKITFPKYDINQIIEHYQTITLKSEFSEKEQSFQIATNWLDDTEKFIFQCLTHQELFYILIKIHNEEEVGNTHWEQIKNTFSILSSKRDTNELTYFNNFSDFDNYIFNERTSINQNMEWFYRGIDKIQTIIKKYTKEKRKLITEEDNENINEKIKKKIYESSFRIKISKAIKTFLEKELFIEFIQDEISIKLKNNHGDFFFLSDLSSWEQSLLLIIFAIYGNDLKNGFIIIDEPELHIHPQLQKELAIFFNQLSINEDIQIFLSTYSALFINEKNITNVYRFVRSTTNTKVYTPQMKIYADDAKLVHILKYENISKIFFVNKIIMVEGESELYFFYHYLKRLQEQPWWEDIVGSWELININGKGSYKSWHKFLNKFWIENYFIGDRDNTVDYGFFTQKEINRFYQLANQHLEKYPKSNGDYYNKLVYTIKKFYPQKYKRIIEWIEDLYSDNIFILKLWAIESYPCLEKKGLQFMINFTNNQFENRLKNHKFNPQKKELIDIFTHIFHLSISKL